MIRLAAAAGSPVARRVPRHPLRQRAQTAGARVADDRYTPELVSRNVTRPEDADSMPYYEAAFHINRLYAQRHGYQFVFHGPGDYLAAGGDRHVAWKKVQHLRDQLECCCQWALWMDSDSFLVMQQHALSVEGWVSLISEGSARMTTLLGNMHPAKGLREGADPVAAVSTNEPHELGPEPFCTSNMLFARTRRSIEILDFWYNATGGVSDLAPFLREFPWEQAPFNYLVSRKFSEAVEPFPLGMGARVWEFAVHPKCQSLYGDGARVCARRAPEAGSHPQGKGVG